MRKQCVHQVEQLNHKEMRDDGNTWNNSVPEEAKKLPTLTKNSAITRKTSYI
jgi:hypothetical protein